MRKRISYVTNILDHQFLPMIVETSILRLTIWDSNREHTNIYEEKGSINDLCKKFGINVEGDTYDFTGFTGRKCNMMIDENGLHSFVSIMNQKIVSTNQSDLSY